MTVPAEISPRKPVTKKPAPKLPKQKNEQPATPLSKSDRVGIIGAINTPLGFFALIVLVVEALIGGTTLLSKLTEPHQFVMLWAMIGMLFLMIALVAAIAVWKPEVLSVELGEATLKARQQEHQQQIENQKLALEQTRQELQHQEKLLKLAQEEAENAKKEAAQTKDLVGSDAMRQIIAEVAEEVYTQKALPPAPSPKSRRRQPHGAEHISPESKE